MPRGTLRRSTMTKEPYKRRRLRTSTPDKPPGPKAPEGERARWWREHVLKLSRPALAERLGVHPATVDRQERAEKVDAMFRLASAALALGLDGWSWGQLRQPPQA